MLRERQSARASCETKPETWFANWCLAVIYNKLGPALEVLERAVQADSLLSRAQSVCLTVRFRILFRKGVRMA